MVLAELGGRIANALKAVANTTIVDESVLDELLKEICSALLESDVNVGYVRELRENIKRRINIQDLPAGMNRRRLIQKAVFDELCALLDSGTKPYKMKKNKSNVVMFVGLQGSGKTTTCSKFAHYYQRRGWKVALVCADTFRAGAFDQLKQNAAKVKVPFYGSYTETDPVVIARDGVDRFTNEGYEVIIVDTSGRHKQEEALFEEMEQVANTIQPNEIIFIMDGSIGQAAYDQARAFKERVPVGAVVITKLDGHAKGGGALSAVAATSSPITHIGVGEQMDDFEEFDPESFVSRILGIGDFKGLFKTIQEAGIENQTELIGRLSKGEITLRDMYEQFQNFLKMGPIGKVMSMLPGFAQELIPKGKEAEGQARLKRFLTIMDSMTDEELDSKQISKTMNESRIRRIARGSGCSIKDVNELLEESKRFQKQIGKMKNMKLGNNPNNMSQVASQMSKLVNPQVMKQMGGMGGMQNMMKQMMGSFKGSGSSS